MRRLAWMILAPAIAGCGREPAAPPGPVPPPPRTAAPWFEEVAARSGIAFTQDSGHETACLFPEIVCGGVALLDMDDDGDLDLYLIQSGSLTEPGGARAANRLYRNDGRGRFDDVTADSGAGDDGYGMGVATGDFDADGDLDVYVTNLGPNTLLRNEGDGTFTDVSVAAGVNHDGWGAGAAFVDYDVDGDLDLFVTNYIAWALELERTCRTSFGRVDYCSPDNYLAPSPDTLYRNEGDGTFTDVSSAMGLRAAFGNGLGVVCADFDDDGLPEIFVANDKNPDQLWRRAADGPFRDVAVAMGCSVDQHGQPTASMGTTASDVDDDGDLDLLVVNLRTESDSFFRNEGTHFVDDTALIGLGAVSRPYTRFGVGLLDFDNDGFLDLYEANGRIRSLSDVKDGEDPYAEPNLLLRGRAGGALEPVGDGRATSPPLIATSRGAAFGDIDGDGGVDIVVVNRDAPVHVLRNVVPARRGWIMLRVVNAAGADAIGATVRCRIGERTVRRDVRTAFSYFAANDPRVHLGLGDAGGITDVRVRWPDGVTERFDDQTGGAVVTLRRGAGRAEPSS